MQATTHRSPAARLGAALLTLALCLALLPTAALAWNPSDSDYTISTAEELAAFRDAVNGGNGFSGVTITLEADIDLSELDAVTWTPIGTEAHPFTGTFDGAGHSITGLNVNVSGVTNYAGLFGYVGQGGVVKNLSVSGTVTGQSLAGGVVGNNYGTIENCYSGCTVNGVFAGGIAGQNDGTVQNCYNTGDVQSVNSGNAGGVVGYNYGQITNCYSTGQVTGTGVGGVVGHGMQGTISSCFFLTGTADAGVGLGNSDGTDELTKEQLAQQSSFTGWDFTDTWAMSTSLAPNRPVLRSIPEDDAFTAGAGTQESPYEIGSAKTLAYYRDKINSDASYRDDYYQLTANINLAELGEEPWTPIGSTTSTPFMGTFDGAGHSITGLNVEATGNENIGLFGNVGDESTGGGMVKNLAVFGTVNGGGYTYAGGVVGNNYGIIENCYSDCTVTGYAAGGIAGHNGSVGTIQNCCSTGSVTGSLDSGGVVGYNRGRISSCCSTSTVSGGTAGGVAGFLNGGTVTGCFYLECDGLNGVGSGSGDVTAMAETYFTSGEAARMLQGTQEEQYWGQTLGEDNYPVLTSDSARRVYLVTFQFGVEGADDAVLYANSGNVPAPSIPDREGFTLTWRVTGSNEAYSEDMTLSADTTFTATWTEISTDPEPEPEPDPTPSRPSGSSSSSSSSSSANRNHTVTAAPTVGGDVDMEPASARAGDRVILTLTPDEGYELDRVTVTDEDGNEVDTVRRSDGSYLFYMPDGDVTVDAVFVPVVTEPEPAPLPFADVPEGAWYYDAVRYVYENGLMTGTGDASFAPYGTASRAMVVTILYRLAGSPSLDGENLGYPFADVDAGSWYGDAVYWARLNGVASGYDGETFGPGDPITREQLAVLLYRYAGSPAPAGSLDSFADAAAASDYAVDALRWAVGEGILTGTGSGLNPAGTATRAELAQILARFVQM